MDLIGLKNGDVLICFGKGEVAKGIGTATGHDETHTGQVVELNGEICVFDAQKEGAFPRQLKNWQAEFKYDFEVYRYNSGFNNKLFGKACIQLFGLDYGVKHLALGFWGKLFGLRKDVKTKYANDGKVICTELTMRLMWVFGKKVNDPQNYTPAEVKEYLLKNNFSLIGKYIYDENN